MTIEYLRRTSTGWVFRRAVPKHLRTRFCRTEIVRCLTRIRQGEVVARARAWGVACEALFIMVDSEKSLTTDEIGHLTKVYLDNQDALFGARLADLDHGLRRSVARYEARIRQLELHLQALPPMVFERRLG